MAKAIIMHAVGGPEVLRWQEHDPGEPGPGQIRIAQQAVGLNYIDVYFRTGVYPVPGLPHVLGQEGAGIVEAVGPGVADFAAGDRVAYANSSGAYAEKVVIAADRAIHVPDAISLTTAAAAMLKGLTAEYLLRRTYPVGPETVLLFHAAAGGVGLIACQWAKALGATVIGTAGSPAKCALARQRGCDHVIDYRTEDFAERVAAITQGKLCDVVYDSVGRDTFPGSLDCLRKRGLWVSFGQSSGKVPPFDIGLLNTKGSLFATRPNLAGYHTSRADFVAACTALFAVIASGAVVIDINQTYPLAEASQAHRALEQRQTSGASVLLI